MNQIQHPHYRTIRPQSQNSLRNSTTTRNRKKVRWNYKRIAGALAILILISCSAAYAGYTIAHKFSDSNKVNIAANQNDKKVKIAASQATTTTTTTTTEMHFEQYTVKSGDTFYDIAKRYQVSIDAIKSANGISPENNDLQIGMILKIPIPAPKVQEIKAKDSSSAPLGKNEQNTKTSTIQASPQEISRGPANVKKVAFTFDAGATSEPTPMILKALNEAGIKATFFLTGQWIEENPDLTKEIVNNGHVIGNHTYSHTDLTKEKEETIRYQLRSTDNLLQKTAGINSKPLFRAPYGARDKRVLRIAADEGYRSIYWTIDSLDWKTNIRPEQVKNRILAGLENGAIILMHCGSSQTSEILPSLITEIKSRGYAIVDVNGLFE